MQVSNKLPFQLPRSFSSRIAQQARQSLKLLKLLCTASFREEPNCETIRSETQSKESRPPSSSRGSTDQMQQFLLQNFLLNSAACKFLQLQRMISRQAGRQVADLQQNSAAGSSTHRAPTGRREHAAETHVGWEIEGNFVCIIVIRVSTIITKGYCGPKLFTSSSVPAHITNWVMQKTTRCS